MDGTWHWDSKFCAYRLNITDSDSESDDFYVMEHWPGYGSNWTIYKNTDGEVDYDDYLAFCQFFDITYCAGQWWEYDTLLGAWRYDKDATSQYNDCSYDECDLSTFTVNDANCMFTVTHRSESDLFYLCSLSLPITDSAKMRCNPVTDSLCDHSISIQFMSVRMASMMEIVDAMSPIHVW